MICPKTGRGGEYPQVYIMWIIGYNYAHSQFGILPTEKYSMHSSQLKDKELVQSMDYEMWRVIKARDLDHVRTLEKVEQWPLAYQPGTKTRYFRDYLLIPSETASKAGGSNTLDPSVLPASP